MPASRHATAASTAYSRKIVGSLYVKATLRHPSRAAVAAISSGDAASASVSISRDFEISQFWQKRQPRLQPAEFFTPDFVTNSLLMKAATGTTHNLKEFSIPLKD